VSISDIKSGGWATRERLTSAQMGLARTELLKCVDGTGGGTYTPSATISIDDLTVGGSSQLKYVSRSVTRIFQDLSGWVSSNTAYWDITSSGTLRPAWYQPAVNAGATMWIPMSLPVGSVLNSVAVTTEGAGHTAAPVTPLLVTVYSSPITGNTITSLGSQSDVTAWPAYDAAHVVSVTGLAHTVLNSLSYWIKITGESGVDSAAGALVYGAYAACTITVQDEWCP